MAKNRKSTEYLAEQTLIGDLLLKAQQFANNTGSAIVSQAVAALYRLESVTPEQVTQTIACVDATMDLTKRFASICKMEREEVVEGSESYESAEEVEPGHARPYTGSDEQRELIRCRVQLVAVYNQLTAVNKPSILSDMVPVPTAGKPGMPQGQGGGTVDPYRRGH